MKQTGSWRFGLLAISVGLLLVAWQPGLAFAGEKEFQIVAGEWSWKAKPGEAPVTNRVGKKVTKIERYVFNPGFIVVDKGDTVVLKIHDIKGSKHQVEIRALGVPETLITRGQMKTIRFVADKAGTFKMVCNNHVDRTKEGPMHMYIYVLDK
jgi:plastocyanin